jgi:hypothetical protein
MRTKHHLRLPKTPGFWRDWLGDDSHPEFNSLQDDGDVTDTIGPARIDEVKRRFVGFKVNP